MHSKPKTENQNHEPLSFHLQLLVGNEFVLPEGKNSVGLLRWPIQRYHDQKAVSDCPENPVKPADKLKSNLSLLKNRAIFESNPSNITGTKFEMWTKKFNNKSQNEGNNDKIWQERLLIVTEKRLFIITKKVQEKNRRGSGVSETLVPENNMEKVQDKDLEIVDSIPMEEIISVEVGSESTPWSNDPALEKSTSSIFPLQLHKLFHKSANQLLEGDSEDLAAKKIRDATEQIEMKVRSPLLPELEREQYCDGILRIRTKLVGFNRGNPYYFMLKKDATSLKGGVGRKDAASLERKERFLPTAAMMRARPLPGRPGRRDSTTLIHEHNSGEVAKMLAKLAFKRKVDFSRETRFIRLQAFLQEIWNSLPFNMVVLLLIVSNFIFTVQQLENNDPGRQRFFETVDMAYTVLFSIGEFRPSH